jgi:hypothetical protein
MDIGPELLLIGAVAAVGVLHTIAPDHWVPITLLRASAAGRRARRRARPSRPGPGHALSTLLIALAVGSPALLSRRASPRPSWSPPDSRRVSPGAYNPRSRTKGSALV